MKKSDINYNIIKNKLILYFKDNNTEIIDIINIKIELYESLKKESFKIYKCNIIYSFNKNHVAEYKIKQKKLDNYIPLRIRKLKNIFNDEE